MIKKPIVWLNSLADLFLNLSSAFFALCLVTQVGSYGREIQFLIETVRNIIGGIMFFGLSAIIKESTST